MVITSREMVASHHRSYDVLYFDTPLSYHVYAKQTLRIGGTWLATGRKHTPSKTVKKRVFIVWKPSILHVLGVDCVEATCLRFSNNMVLWITFWRLQSYWIWWCQLMTTFLSASLEDVATGRRCWPLEESMSTESFAFFEFSKHMKE